MQVVRHSELQSFEQFVFLYLLIEKEIYVMEDDVDVAVSWKEVVANGI
ncbi:MAG: hypothetical protein Q9P01_11795 [Anaerolineae bacterium]|nr:hypothetical protein [Anaerolineae bacterium]